MVVHDGKGIFEQAPFLSNGLQNVIFVAAILEILLDL
jgi:hypothetical protein